MQIIRPLLRAAKYRTQDVVRAMAWRWRKKRVARVMDRPPRAPHPDELRGATLFFIPYAGVTPMFAQASVVGRVLAERGHRVVFARCFEAYERCPVMDMHYLPYDASKGRKRESCLRCADNSLSMLANYGLEAFDLRPFLGPEIMASIDAFIADGPEDLRQFEFDGLAFGLLSVMDLVLAKKISNFHTLSSENRDAWRQYLRGCLASYFLIEQLCKEFGVARIVHANDYSIPLGARVAARKYNVPCYGLAFPGHRNVDLRRYLMLSNVWKPFSFQLLAEWPSCRDLSLDVQQVREVAEDLLARLSGRGSHIYSPGKTADQSDIRHRLGLCDDRRLIVAYTSSLDEVLASRMGVDALGIALPGREQPFHDQIDWLHRLTAFVEQSDDLQLVVRIHPREGVNKRESVPSEHLSRLRAAFDRDYRWCRFIWPEEPVSSYDLGEAADVALISWSNIGLELARLGVPVLVAFNGADSAIPWDDFLEWAPNADAYFEKLRELLDSSADIERIARAFRWYHLLTLGTTVDLGDIVPRSDFSALPEYKTPREAATIEEVLIGGKNICELNVARLRARQEEKSRERELGELHLQLARLIHYLMTGDYPPGTTPISFGDEGTCGRFLLHLGGGRIEYRNGDRTFRRYSPMVARLAALCTNQRKDGVTVAGGRP